MISFINPPDFAKPQEDTNEIPTASRPRCH
jgi:hypothetical protein